MTALQKIRAMYRRHLPECNLSDDIDAYLEVGLVVSTPKFFLMARAIERDNPQAWDHWAAYDNPDTWLIWAAAGPAAVSVKTFCLQAQPYPLKYVAWARRDGPLKFYRILSNERPLRN